MFGYKLTLISPHYVPDEAKEFFDEVYRSWKVTFTEVVEGAGGKLDPDDFFRCDVIPVITTPQGQIVAFANMTKFDIALQAVREHHYIKVLTPETVFKLESHGIHRLISAEYLNVVPEFRKATADINWLEIMCIICVTVMKNSEVDAGIGMPRIDRKVDQVLYGVGGVRLQEPISKMNYPCDILLFPKTKDQPSRLPGSLAVANALWKNRVIVGDAETTNRFKKVA